jgi:hypothetical protein
VTAQVCPVCSTPRSGTDRFCENDGYDFQSGRHPVPIPGSDPVAVDASHHQTNDGSPNASAPPVRWTASADADRGYYDRNGVDGVEFPAVCPRREFTLTGSEIRIGRRSQSKGINPEIDLSGPPLDPGISHLHAVLTATGSGWQLIDPGSTNGTTINDGIDPIKAPIDLADGDRIHLGAWTTITLHVCR